MRLASLSTARRRLQIHAPPPSAHGSRASLPWTLPMIPAATDTFSSRSSCSVHLLCTPRMLGRARERERCSVFAHVRRLGLVMWPPRRAGTEMRPGSRPSDGSMVNPDWAGHLILSIPPRGAHGGRAENAIYIFFCVTGWVRLRERYKVASGSCQIWLLESGGVLPREAGREHRLPINLVEYPNVKIRS